MQTMSGACSDRGLNLKTGLKAWLGIVFSFAILAGGPIACSTTTSDPAVGTPEDALAALEARRIALSEQVAWQKFQSSLPVSDPVREHELMQELVAYGQSKGLPAREVEVFFQRQFAISRKTQRRLIRAWQTGAPLPVYPPQDLRTQLRPQLLAVSREMIDLLARSNAVTP